MDTNQDAADEMQKDQDVTEWVIIDGTWTYTPLEQASEVLENPTPSDQDTPTELTAVPAPVQLPIMEPIPTIHTSADLIKPIQDVAPNISDQPVSNPVALPVSDDSVDPNLDAYGLTTASDAGLTLPTQSLLSGLTSRDEAQAFKDEDASVDPTTHDLPLI